jgi:hypothetical protein
MALLGQGFGALLQALAEQGFCMVDEFEVFMTFARDNDPLKIHVGPDGSFAAFDGDDRLIAEGEGRKHLHRALAVSR